MIAPPPPTKAPSLREYFVYSGLEKPFIDLPKYDEESEKHPNCIDHRSEEEKKNKDPIVRVRVLGFGDSSVNLRAWVWAEDAGKGFVMACDLNKIIKESFDKEGIEIPFPYRTIVYKKDMGK